MSREWNVVLLNFHSLLNEAPGAKDNSLMKDVFHPQVALNGPRCMHTHMRHGELAGL
jgi:hypothetical protein